VRTCQKKNPAHYYGSGKRCYYLTSYVFLIITSLSYYLVALCSYLMNYSDSDLFTFPCNYFDSFTRVIFRLVTSCLGRVNCLTLEKSVYLSDTLKSMSILLVNERLIRNNKRLAKTSKCSAKTSSKLSVNTHERSQLTF
jgi:hypothetical protein